jgi:hypothetical protein
MGSLRTEELHEMPEPWLPAMPEPCMRPRGSAPRAGVFVALLGALLLPGRASADWPPHYSMSVHTSPETLSVGDRVQVDVEVEAPPPYQVSFPSALPGIDAKRVELRDFQLVPPEKGKKNGGSEQSTGPTTWIGRYTLALFAVGDITLPGVPVRIQAGEQIIEAHTDSLRLHVQSVLNDSLANAEIRDIKPQRDIPVPVPIWVWVLLGGLAVAALAIWWIIRRRRRREAPPVPVAPPRPAHEVALAELRRLETLRLPFEGKIKEHYVRLSEILRRYLEDSPHFAMSALEETTYEIVRELREKGYLEPVVDELAAMCDESDLVKFAKLEPTIEECNVGLERVRRFVIETSKPTARLREEPEAVLAMVGAAAGSAVAGDGAAAASPDRGDGAGPDGGSAGAAGGAAAAARIPDEWTPPGGAP